MAATPRLTCAAFALLAALATAGSDAHARSGGRASSLLAALAATDTALLGEVLEAEDAGTRASVRVLATLRGVALPERISVRAGAQALLEGDVRLVEGQTSLLLVSRSGGAFELPGGLRAAQVPVDGTAGQDEASTLVRGVLAALGGANADDALGALLRRSVGVANVRLRAGVLEDLSRRLGPGDAPFLLGLAQDRGAPQDVRVFAIHGLGALPSPPPAELAGLLEPSEPVAVRQAAVDAYASLGVREGVERGLADPDAAVRRKAVENLASPASVAVLERQFARESAAAVQVAIVKQLGLMATPESRLALRRLLAESPDAAVREAGEPWLAAEP